MSTDQNGQPVRDWNKIARISFSAFCAAAALALFTKADEPTAKPARTPVVAPVAK